jgi:hypothetical protein
MDRWHWVQFEMNMSERRGQMRQEAEGARLARAAERKEKHAARKAAARPTFWSLLFGRLAVAKR